MKRYNHHGAATTVEHPEGMWVLWEDVSRLEAINADLLEALQEVVAEYFEWWDSDSTVGPSVHGMMIRLRAAIAKAEGNVDPITDEEEVV